MWTCLEARGTGLACGSGRCMSQQREGGLGVSISLMVPSSPVFLLLLASPTPFLHGSTSPSPILPLRSQGLRGTGERLSLLTQSTLNGSLQSCPFEAPPNLQMQIKSKAGRTSDAEKSYDLMRPVSVELCACGALTAGTHRQQGS